MVNMNERLVCPLLKKNCLEMSCAWWLPEENMCSLANIARAINTQKKMFY